MNVKTAGNKDMELADKDAASVGSGSAHDEPHTHE